MNESTAGTLAPRVDWNDIGKTEHFVQFYEEDGFLVQSVADFLGAGLQGGGPVIMISTPEHRDAVEQQLQRSGLDLDAARREGRYRPLDAADTLAMFMVNGMPDETRFREVVGGLVARTTESGEGLRAFGEMVALLWAEGNGAAAIRLEELWNALGRDYDFTLFCAYPLRDFRGEPDGRTLLHVCKTHARVVPAESYSAHTEADERLRTIALLQHKAGVLEAEIVERKKAERALARREHELRDFLENATEGIHQVGPDGTILWVNRAELDLLGYTASEYIGHHIAEFHGDAAVIADILARLSRGEVLRDYEAPLKHKDGSIRYVAINSSVYWEDGQFVHTRCFTRDITDRKRAADRLEEMVRERTAKLEEMIAELEGFSYSISHDMRSPLRAISGYAKSLLEDYGSRLDGEALTRIERMQRAALRLDLLIRDVLAYSKVTKDDIALGPIALGRLADDLLHQHPEFERQRECVTIERPLHAVIGHEAYLSQCLTNLLSNALKFVHPGARPQVRIRSEVVGALVRVWVSDRGVGIHPEHHDRIFSMFGRVYPEKQYEGTGIGLAIAKKAVTRMGGEIGFRSTPGEGSEFWFTLPQGRDAD